MTAIVGTLTEALAARGYGHRKATITRRLPAGPIEVVEAHGREVFRISDGQIMGVFDAAEAWAWLAQQGEK